MYLSMKTLINSFLVFTLLVPLFAYSQDQGENEQEILERIIEAGDEIEVVHVDPNDPLLSEDNEDCVNPEANTNIKNLAKHLVQDTGSILLAPIGWKKEDWLKASAVVAGIMLLSTQDQNVKHFFQNNRSETTEKITWPLEKLGNGGSALALLGAGYVTSLAIKDPKLQNATLTAVEALAVAGVLTTIGKHAVHRQRPYTTDNQYLIHGPFKKSGNVSFPSGHTGSAFAIATVFAEAYKDSSIIPLLAYSAATLAGISRIHDNKHWVSDVAGGAVLGYLAGKFVSNRRLLTSKDSNVKVSPMLNFGRPGGVGATVTISLGKKKKK